jgi:hypothetical protein
MNMLTTFRWAIKQISGAATVPPSGSHKNGDWTPNDLYIGELAMDAATGRMYTRDNGGIIEMGGDAALMKRKVRVTSAEILTAFTTPVELVPQPVSGKVIVPVKIARVVNYGTTPYATNTTSRFYIQDAGSNLVTGIANDLAFNSNRVDLFDFQTSQQALRTEKPFLFSVLAGNPTAGDSDIFLHVYYILMTL